MDVKGRILIPGIDDQVASLTETEANSYDQIDFDMVVFRAVLTFGNLIFQFFKVITFTLMLKRCNCTGCPPNDYPSVLNLISRFELCGKF